jgi:dipeptidyl aminopeptidase/acylaminoacyl peptidase
VRQGKEVLYVRYPAESSHGLSRSGPPDLRRHRLEQYLAWWRERL